MVFKDKIKETLKLNTFLYISRNVPRSNNNPDWIRSLGLPNSINNNAVNNEIQPINKYIYPINNTKNIKLNN